MPAFCFRKIYEPPTTMNSCHWYRPMPISWIALFNNCALPSYTGSIEPLSSVGTSTSSFGSRLLKLGVECTLAVSLDLESASILLSMFLFKTKTDTQWVDPNMHPRDKSTMAQLWKRERRLKPNGLRMLTCIGLTDITIPLSRGTRSTHEMM